jgi:anthranilate phosphoribosyltransferase
MSSLGFPAGRHFRFVRRTMAELAAATAALQTGHELDATTITACAAALAAAEVDERDKATFLTALADKGETPVEVAALACAFRARALDPGVGEWSAEAVDIVGTGGDHAGGFNISSLVVLTLAALGVKVMKHGNRGITSACGSADLLAGLGVRLDAPPEKQRAALAELGYCFFFAPAYHPAFKHIMPVRKALAAEGRRTVFNILGPLINPGRPAHILLGVFSPVWVPRLAQVLDLLGTSAGLVAHGRLADDRGIDEITTASANLVQGLGRQREVSATWTAADFGLPVAAFDDLRGGDLNANLATVGAILAGRGPAGLVDTIVLNAALALWVTGRVERVEAGLEPAREALLGGAVTRKIAATREFYAA